MFLIPCSVNPILKSKIRNVNFDSAIFDVKEHIHIMLKLFRRLQQVLSSSDEICSVLFASSNNNHFQSVIFARFSLLSSFLKDKTGYFSTHFIFLIRSFFFNEDLHLFLFFLQIIYYPRNASRIPVDKQKNKFPVTSIDFN